MSLADVIGLNADTLIKVSDPATRSFFRYWRIRILYSTILGYAAFYLLRQNFSFAIPGLMEEFQLSKTDMGSVSSAFFIIYGVGKFVNGYLSDRSDARYFMAIGLLLSAIFTFMIGLSAGIIMIGILWALNAWVQSMGWPPTARLISHWYSPKELGTKWALCSSSHQLGAVVISFLAPFLITTYGWRYAFFIPAIIGVVFAFFLFDRLRDTPKEVGLPPVEEYKGDALHVSDSESERITLSEVWTQVFSNKLVWFVGIGNLCLYIPRLGIMVWAPTFLKEVKGVSLIVAGSQTAAFEAAGLFGGLAAGWISDKIFKGRRGPVACIFLLLTTLALYLEWMVPAGFPWIDTIVLMAAGFLVYGPQVLAGLAATDFASKRAAGVATGLIGTMAYVAASISGVGVGFIVDNYGWGSGFALFVISGLIGAFFFGLTWNHRAKILDQNKKFN